jgi:putative flippase GtrA
VKVSPSALLEHARTDEGRKQMRYAVVSLIFVPVGQVLIQVLGAFVFSSDVTNAAGVVTGKEVNWVAASIASAAILTVPNFFANKHWVWRNTSRENLRAQVAVFWVAAMLGVTFATLLTYLADYVVKSHGWVEKAAVFVAQLTGFGIVWLGRYFILDRWLFKVVTHHDPGEDDLEMLHGDLPI